jgi:GNAT superfamily N-acetyltransferase
MNLQKATPTDVPTIAALTDAAYEKYIPRIGRKPQPMTADYNAMLGTHEIWVLREPDILGFLVLQKEESILFIYSTVVSPAHQGKGSGKQLLLWTEEYALENGCDTIRLYTNEKMLENIGIYLNFGYTETHREDMKGFQVVHMAKSVGSDSRIKFGSMPSL